MYNSLAPCEHVASDLKQLLNKASLNGLTNISFYKVGSVSGFSGMDLKMSNTSKLINQQITLQRIPDI